VVSSVDPISELESTIHKETFGEEKTRISQLFQLHEEAPIFYGFNIDQDSSAGSSLDNCELPFQLGGLKKGEEDESDRLTADNDDSTEVVPFAMEPIVELQDPYKLSICLELLERGETNHARRIATCQKRSVELKCGSCGSHEYTPITCGSRLCPDCMENRQGQLIGEYGDVVASWENPTMLTLTIENTEKPVEKKDEITESFTRFRQRKIPSRGGEGEHSWAWRKSDEVEEVVTENWEEWRNGLLTKQGEETVRKPAGTYWKSKLLSRGHHGVARFIQERYVDENRNIPVEELLRGGFYGVDIKQQKDGSYNVHIHVLCNMFYIPQGAISELWEDVSGSSVIDVRRCYGTGEKGTQDALAEVVGYATKPPQFEEVEDTVDVIQELKGSCLVQPFGTLHGNVGAADSLRCPSCDEMPSWKYEGVVDMVINSFDVEADDTIGENDPP
jgi:hypothetical protein